MPFVVGDDKARRAPPDETDPDVQSVVRDDDRSILVPGSFPIHDLVDLDVEVPEGNYTTLAGLVLARLGYLPRTPGDTVEVAGRPLEVVEIRERTQSPGSASIRQQPAQSPDR